jgi:hypothetical protein
MIENFQQQSKLRSAAVIQLNQSSAAASTAAKAIMQSQEAIELTAS